MFACNFFTKYTHFKLRQFIKSSYCCVKTKLSDEVCTRFNSNFQLKRVPVVSMQFFLRPIINNIWCFTKHTHFELRQFIKSWYCYVKTKLSDEVFTRFNPIKRILDIHRFFIVLFLCYIINGSSFSRFYYCDFFNFTSLMDLHSSERIIFSRIFINVSIFLLFEEI